MLRCARRRARLASATNGRIETVQQQRQEEEEELRRTGSLGVCVVTGKIPSALLMTVSLADPVSDSHAAMVRGSERRPQK